MVVALLEVVMEELSVRVAHDVEPSVELVEAQHEEQLVEAQHEERLVSVEMLVEQLAF